MAARKSCTHLTWAEAKARVGGSSGPSTSTKKSKNPPKNVAHNQILAQKIIAKQGGPNKGEELVGKKSLRKLQREDEKAAAAIAAAKEERERERRNRTVRPYDLAQDRSKELAKSIQQKKQQASSASSSSSSKTMEEMRQIAECKGMQLDELLALEAIFPADTEEYGVCECTKLEELRQAYEDWMQDEDNESLLKALVASPQQFSDISFTLLLNIPDEMNILLSSLENGNETTEVSSDSSLPEAMELVATIVLQVTLPSLYPNGSVPPIITIQDCMVTDKNATCNPDKPLESLAFLDETNLRQDMMAEIQGILPYPCVYEVGVTWLTENIFQYLKLNTHPAIGVFAAATAATTTLGQ